MAEQATERFEINVTPTQMAKIEQLAEQEQMTQKEAVLRAVGRALGEEEGGSESVLALTDDLCGSVDGPEDLSTNPEHMEDYGTD